MSHQYTFDSAPAAALLGLMAHAKRLRVLELIVQREWDVSSLALEVGLSQSALSPHLKKLRDAKLVRVRRESQTIYYSCTSPSVVAMLTVLADLFAAPHDFVRAA